MRKGAKLEMDNKTFKIRFNELFRGRLQGKMKRINFN